MRPRLPEVVGQGLPSRITFRVIDQFVGLRRKLWITCR